MQVLKKENPGGQAGVPRMHAGEHGFRSQDAYTIRKLQHRLSGFALALEAVRPELAFLEQAVELTARGMPLPGGGQIRLHKLALTLFDLREVLEYPMPEEVCR